MAGSTDIDSLANSRSFTSSQLFMAWRTMRAPLAASAQPTVLYRMDLTAGARKGGEQKASTRNLRHAHITRETIPSDGPVPAEHPGRGAVSVASDIPPLIMISRLLGYVSPPPKKAALVAHEHGGQHQDRRGSRRVSLTETSVAMANGESLAELLGHQEQESTHELLKRVMLVSYPRVVIYALGLASVGILNGLLVSQLGPFLMEPEQAIDYTNSTCSDDAGGIENLRGHPVDVARWLYTGYGVQVSHT